MNFFLSELSNVAINKTKKLTKHETEVKIMGKKSVVPFKGQTLLVKCKVEENLTATIQSFALVVKSKSNVKEKTLN